MKRTSLVPEFVVTVPEDLEPGKLYVSTRFRTASHLCACGCGNKVVTPLKPAKWHITVEDGLVSLSPSIGSWQLPCKSHYWIRENKVLWSRAFSEDEIMDVLERDAKDLHDYYAARHTTRAKKKLFSRLWAWLRRK